MKPLLTADQAKKLSKEYFLRKIPDEYIKINEEITKQCMQGKSMLGIEISLSCWNTIHNILIDNGFNVNCVGHSIKSYYVEITW